jgi:hypothetical protein
VPKYDAAGPDVDTLTTMTDFRGQVDVLAELPPQGLDLLQERLIRESGLFDQRISPSPWIYDLWGKQEGTIISHIVFGFPRSLSDHREPLRHALFDDWADLIEPLRTQATEIYGYIQGRTTRLMLARLEPGCSLRPHMDDDLASQVPHKIHIPLVTHEDAGLWIDGNRYHLPRGYAYEVNNRTLHWADNLSDTPRIHLIFDYWEAASDQSPLTGTSRFAKTARFDQILATADDMTWGFEEGTFDLLRAPAPRHALKCFLESCEHVFQLDALCATLRLAADQHTPDWALERDALRTITGLREAGAITIEGAVAG